MTSTVATACVAAVMNSSSRAGCAMAGCMRPESITNTAQNHEIRVYITGGTVMPITASTRINSRRTTAAVASSKRFRPSSASVRM